MLYEDRCYKRRPKSSRQVELPLTPKQCAELKKNLKISIVVQPSTSRCFSDEEYVHEGIDIVKMINDCDILLVLRK